MSDIKISALPTATTPLTGAELVPVVQGGVTKQTTATAIFTTGVLPVVNGGTGTATPALVPGSNVTITGTWPNQTINSTSSATVTNVSVVSANGLAGTVANPTTTPAITLSTSVTGVVKGNGTTLSAATAGTDYVAPGGALGTPSSGTVTNLTGTASININGTVGATTPAAGTFTSLNTGQLAGLRNKIINGGFDIWQRGTSGFTSNTFSADRWLAVTNGTTTTSRQTFTPGAAPVAGYEAAYYLRYDRTATGTYQYLEQRVEDVRTFAGQTVTLSFFAKANSAITITPYCEQYYGTGGSPSASTACTSSSTVTITTSWARYSVQVTVPSISGKTLGTNNDSSLIVRPIYIVDALAHTIDIWGVQLEIGSVATPFEQRPYGMELGLCQRYYQEVCSPGTSSQYFLSGGMMQSTTAAAVMYRAVVPFRANPTLTYSALADFNIYAGTSVSASASIGVSAQLDPKYQLISFTASSALTNGAPVMFYTNTTTARIALSAEL